MLHVGNWCSATRAQSRTSSGRLSFSWSISSAWRTCVQPMLGRSRFIFSHTTIAAVLSPRSKWPSINSSQRSGKVPTFGVRRGDGARGGRQRWVRAMMRGQATHHSPVLQGDPAICGGQHAWEQPTCEGFLRWASERRGATRGPRAFALLPWLLPGGLPPGADSGCASRAQGQEATRRPTADELPKKKQCASGSA